MKEMQHGLKDMDDELKHALGREEPPAGFAERVLRRVGDQPAGEPSRLRPFGPGITGGSKGPALQGVSAPAARSRLPFVQWAAAAALVAAVAGGIQYRAKQRERAEGEAAKERVVQALHIAGTKLQLVQTKINRLHEQPDKNVNQ